MHLIKSIIFSAAFLAVFSLVAFGQEEPLRVETNLVTLNVAVTDKNGNYVRNLTKGDFEIYDGRTKKNIDDFSAENAPVYFGIIYDLHPAVDERTANLLAAMRQWTRDFAQKDDFFVTVFNERGSLTTDFVPTEEQIRQNLNETQKASPNSLYDAIFAASEKVRQRRSAKQVLIVLTDGEDHQSHHSLKELRTHLRSINLPIYTIAFHDERNPRWGYTDLQRNGRPQLLGAAETSQLNTAALAEISKTSGGKTFEREVLNRYFLNAIFRKVQSEVENQYVIGFYPEKFDGKWHKLRVSVKAPAGQKYRLSNRRGYQSQAKSAKGE